MEIKITPDLTRGKIIEIAERLITPYAGLVTGHIKTTVESDAHKLLPGVFEVDFGKSIFVNKRLEEQSLVNIFQLLCSVSEIEKHLNEIPPRYGELFAVSDFFELVPGSGHYGCFQVSFCRNIPPKGVIIQEDEILTKLSRYQDYITFTKK